MLDIRINNKMVSPVVFSISDTNFGEYVAVDSLGHVTYSCRIFSMHSTASKLTIKSYTTVSNYNTQFVFERNLISVLWLKELGILGVACRNHHSVAD